MRLLLEDGAESVVFTSAARTGNPLSLRGKWGFATIQIINSLELCHTSDGSSVQFIKNICDLIQRGLQIFSDFLRQHVRGRHVSVVLQRFVAQPEDVQADFVARRFAVKEQHVGFNALGVLLQQAFVDRALDVHVHAQPGFAVDQVNQPFELGRVPDFVLRFAEDDRYQVAAFAQFGQGLGLLALQFIAFQMAQTIPVVPVRDSAGLAQFGDVFVVHFQEQQVGQLFQVVTVRDAVITQHVAIIPDTVHDSGCRRCGHDLKVRMGILLLRKRLRRLNAHPA